MTNIYYKQAFFYSSIKSISQILLVNFAIRSILLFLGSKIIKLTFFVFFNSSFFWGV